MIKYSNLQYIRPFEAGVKVKGNEVTFTCDLGKENVKKAGVNLYLDGVFDMRLDFDLSRRQGNLVGLKLVFDSISGITYNYFVNDSVIPDKYATGYVGNDQFGVPVSVQSFQAVIENEEYEWGNDCSLNIPFNELILYGLNVHSFTSSKTSKVSSGARGKFEGVVEKIPHLKKLGINGIVLMPCYEYDECNSIFAKDSPANSMEETVKNAKEAILPDNRVNCWGFVEGFYFAPKNSFSGIQNSRKSFKNMVRSLHRNGIEVFMQIYFPVGIYQGDIIRILKFWVSEYHVDGFRISGFDIPHKMIINEPSLSSTKLWLNYIPEEEINDSLKKPYKNVCVENWGFRNDLRKFLKGDEGLINSYIYHQKRNPSEYGVINIICDYDGFTLLDLNSYERKHNEDNGENNADGNNANFSWNCGIEGETKKKYILLLRKKQIKNALLLLMLSEGIPYIWAGDEFGNSGYGNNNLYCQDNEKGYVEWKDTVLSRELLEFAVEVINLRKSNPLFHPVNELKNLDTLGVGFPDLSYHGFEAWRPDLGYNSRMIGMYFEGAYAGSEGITPSYYVGINMHWENHRLAVPKLKNGKKYIKIIDTGNGTGTSKDNEIPVGERSIVVYETR